MKKSNQNIKPNTNLSQFELRFIAGIVFTIVCVDFYISYLGTKVIEENTKSNYEMIEDRKHFINKIEILNNELDRFDINTPGTK